MIGLESCDMVVANKQVNEVQADSLREVANIGMGNAVTALVEMTGQRFTMSIPAFGIVEMSAFDSVLGDPEALAAAIYMPVDGDVSGHVAFLFPFKCACELADMLLYQPFGTTTELGEMEASALMEV